MSFFSMFTEKSIKRPGIEDGRVEDAPSIQLHVKEEVDASETAEKTPARYVPVCEDVTEPFGLNIDGCKHSTEAFTTTLHGANHIFDSIASKSGSVIYSVCADCHSVPDEFIGITRRRNRRIGNCKLDQHNPHHISIMLGSPCAPYFLREDGSIEVNKHSLPSTTGLEEIQPTNAKAFQVQRSRRKEYRRRTGMLGELLLTQTHMRLTDAEQDAVRLALNNGKKRRFEN